MIVTLDNAATVSNCLADAAPIYCQICEAIRISQQSTCPHNEQSTLHHLVSPHNPAPLSVLMCRYGGGGRGHMISNGQEGYGGPRQLMDRPWEEQRMQGGPGSRRTDGQMQPPSQQHVGPMQNGTNILAAVGQQVHSDLFQIITLFMHSGFILYSTHYPFDIQSHASTLNTTLAQRPVIHIFQQMLQ